MGNVQPWRKLEEGTFAKAEEKLKKTIKKEFANIPLNLCIVGHTGAGKSSFINGIFSISRGRIVDISPVISESFGGVGTLKLFGFKSRTDDLFREVKIIDTMGFVQTEADTGISENDLSKVLKGEIRINHSFNAEEHNPVDNTKENKPHCVMIVVSAEVLNNLNDGKDSIMTTKLKKLHTFLPSEVSRIVVVTKCDVISDMVCKDITNIFKCKTVYAVVQKASALIGTPENMVFPVVNYFSEHELNAKKNVPILKAMLFALRWASDRKDNYE